MTQSPRQGDGLPLAARRSYRMPERPLHGCVHTERADGGIMPKIDILMMRMAFFIIKPQAGRNMLTGFCEEPEQPARRPRGVVRLQQDIRVVKLARDPKEIGGNLD